MSDDLLRLVKLYERELERLRAFEVPVKSPIFLTTPLTSTSWDGDSFSTVAIGTQIDLSAEFGVLAGVKAVLVRVECRDSGGAADGVLVALGPSSAASYQIVNRPPGGDLKQSVMEICNCDANGDIFYRVGASGASTMDIWLEIWGYWLP